MKGKSKQHKIMAIDPLNITCVLLMGTWFINVRNCTKKTSQNNKLLRYTHTHRDTRDDDFNYTESKWMQFVCTQHCYMMISTISLCHSVDFGMISILWKVFLSFFLYQSQRYLRLFSTKKKKPKFHVNLINFTLNDVVVVVDDVGDDVVIVIF